MKANSFGLKYVTKSKSLQFFNTSLFIIHINEVSGQGSSSIFETFIHVKLDVFFIRFHISNALVQSSIVSFLLFSGDEVNSSFANLLCFSLSILVFQ
jgi:hypothetical protein